MATHPVGPHYCSACDDAIRLLQSQLAAAQAEVERLRGERDKEQPMVTITRENLYRALKAASLFQSADENFSVCGVYFEHEDGFRLVATDGHTLAAIAPICKQGSTPRTGIILAAPHVAELLKLLKPSKATADQEFTLAFSDDRKITVTGPDVVFERAGVDSQFPPWREVVPEKGNGNPAAGLFGVNPVYLARAGTAAKYFDSDARGNARGFEFSTPRDALAPMRMDYRAPLHGDMTLVVMPMRI